MFGAQEPGTNAEVKKFAQHSVALASAGRGSNTIMFSKSNLNNLSCTYAGQDACSLASTHCCAQNDGVYEYLLAQTKPGTIKWNFDKIIVDQDGKPYGGEVILHGEAVDETLSAIIDDLLGSAKSAGLAASARTENVQSTPIFLDFSPVCLAFVGMVIFFVRARRPSPVGISSVENYGEYIRV